MVLDLHVTTTRKHDIQITPRLTRRNRKRFRMLTRAKATMIGGAVRGQILRYNIGR